MIGYANLLETASSITVTSEATGFEKENAYNWNTFDYWKGTSTATQDYDIDMGSAQLATYAAIFAHDLHTQGATIELFSSTFLVSTSAQ